MRQRVAPRTTHLGTLCVVLAGGAACQSRARQMFLELMPGALAAPDRLGEHTRAAGGLRLAQVGPRSSFNVAACNMLQ